MLFSLVTVYVTRLIPVLEGCSAPENGRISFHRKALLQRKKRFLLLCGRQEHRRPHVLCAEFQTVSGANIQTKQ